MASSAFSRSLGSQVDMSSQSCSPNCRRIIGDALHGWRNNILAWNALPPPPPKTPPVSSRPCIPGCAHQRQICRHILAKQNFSQQPLAALPTCSQSRCQTTLLQWAVGEALPSNLLVKPRHCNSRFTPLLFHWFQGRVKHGQLPFHGNFSHQHCRHLIHLILRHSGHNHCRPPQLFVKVLCSTSASLSMSFPLPFEINGANHQLSIPGSCRCEIAGPLCAIGWTRTLTLTWPLSSSNADWVKASLHHSGPHIHCVVLLLLCLTEPGQKHFGRSFDRFLSTQLTTIGDASSSTVFLGNAFLNPKTAARLLCPFVAFLNSALTTLVAKPTQHNSCPNAVCTWGGMPDSLPFPAMMALPSSTLWFCWSQSCIRCQSPGWKRIQMIPKPRHLCILAGRGDFFQSKVPSNNFDRIDPQVWFFSGFEGSSPWKAADVEFLILQCVANCITGVIIKQGLCPWWRLQRLILIKCWVVDVNICHGGQCMGTSMLSEASLVHSRETWLEWTSTTSHFWTIARWLPYQHFFAQLSHEISPSARMCKTAKFWRNAFHMCSLSHMFISFCFFIKEAVCPFMLYNVKMQWTTCKSSGGNLSIFPRLLICTCQANHDDCSIILAPPRVRRESKGPRPSVIFHPGVIRRWNNIFVRWDQKDLGKCFRVMNVQRCLLSVTLKNILRSSTLVDLVLQQYPYRSWEFPPKLST